MVQVSRDKNLKIPKQLKIECNKINSIEDEVAIKKAIAIAERKKFNKEAITEDLKERDKEWESVIKIPENANDLIVVTVVKKLGAYIITVTEKSPAKYRGIAI